MFRTRRAVLVATGLLVAVTPVVAHEGHGDGRATGPALGVGPSLAFLISLLVVGTAIYLDHRGSIDRRWVDVGALVGVLGALVSVVLMV